MEGNGASCLDCLALNLIGLFLIAVILSLLLALTEVASAFRDRPWHAVFNPWAIPLYVLYGLLTILLGLVLFENDVLSINWTSAILLGLAGPALFKTQVKLFKPISGQEGASASLERLVSGVQQFCFAQINRGLAKERISRKEQLTTEPEDRLLKRLRALYPDEEYQKIEPLIRERQEAEPSSVKALIVDLIERKDPEALNHPLDGEQNNR